MPINEYNTVVGSVTISTGQTGYLDWWSFGARVWSVQPEWTVVASATASAALEVTNDDTIAANASSGWYEVSAVPMDSIAAVDGGQWQPVVNCVVRRCRLKYVHNSGGAATIVAYVERNDPNFGG